MKEAFYDSALSQLDSASNKWMLCTYVSCVQQLNCVLCINMFSSVRRLLFILCVFVYLCGVRVRRLAIDPVVMRSGLATGHIGIGIGISLFRNKKEVTS